MLCDLWRDLLTVHRLWPMITDSTLKGRLEALAEHGDGHSRYTCNAWVLPSGAVAVERRHIPVFCSKPGCLLHPGHRGVCLVIG